MVQGPQGPHHGRLGIPISGSRCANTACMSTGTTGSQPRQQPPQRGWGPNPNRQLLQGHGQDGRKSQAEFGSRRSGLHVAGRYPHPVNNTCVLGKGSGGHGRPPGEGDHPLRGMWASPPLLKDTETKAEFPQGRRNSAPDGSALATFCCPTDFLGARTLKSMSHVHETSCWLRPGLSRSSLDALSEEPRDSTTPACQPQGVHLTG